MILYRYKMKVPSDIRYGNWEYKFTIMAILSILSIFIEYFNGSAWLIVYCCLMQSVLIGVFSDKLKCWTGILWSFIIYVGLLSSSGFTENQSLILILGSLYFVTQLVVFLLAEKIDAIQTRIKKLGEL
ncbi:hypothetical protein [Pleionea sediminis]|uniref:hypothetical protein n=1 Tax=Pleionea sediminis TaxID=2569479 RepID=UPI001185E382|nr:hypothetical protein [Pleionea sediminis]